MCMGARVMCCPRGAIGGGGQRAGEKILGFSVAIFRKKAEEGRRERELEGRHGNARGEAEGDRDVRIAKVPVEEARSLLGRALARRGPEAARAAYQVASCSREWQKGVSEAPTAAGC